MTAIARGLTLLTVTAMLIGCAVNVPLKKVYGRYKASYPFGAEIIILNADGSFVQEVAIKGKPPVTLKGKWDFDSEESRLNFDHLMVVVDGVGHLKSDWRSAPPGLASLDVERQWFRIVMASAATYPYVKQ